MSTIKSIKVKDSIYDLQATYDGAGNEISKTYVKNSEVPTKVSQLENDETYLTETQGVAIFASKTELNDVKAELNKKITDLSNNIDLYSYGVEWDVTVASPILTRIGNPLLHKSLPIQSAYRGCVANGGVVNYYLCPTNWAYKEDGTTPSVLDGTDGTVRVHIPKFYGKSGSDGNKRWVRISTVKIDDTWVEIPEMLVDAYKCTVDTTTASTPKAVSVVNTTAAFRGGKNRESFDQYLETDPFRTDLGKPMAGYARAAMRTCANNAGSELLCYEYYKWIFYWNYVIEYANFNCQVAYNEELTSDGYHQGGLGNGVTDWDSEAWTRYNNVTCITPNGFNNAIGNFTGIKNLVIPASTAIDGNNSIESYTFSVPRWRGFDNPFGDIWTNLDGVIIKRPAENEISSVYTTTNPEEFTDSIGNKSIAGYEVAKDGFIKEFALGDTAEIIPSNCEGASATTYMCDYHYCDASSTELRTLRVGGSLNHSNNAGLGYLFSGSNVGIAASDIGYRTLTRV